MHVHGLQRGVGPFVVAARLPPGTPVAGLVRCHIFILPRGLVVDIHRTAGITATGGIGQGILQTGSDSVAVSHVLENAGVGAARVLGGAIDEHNVADDIIVRPGQAYIALRCFIVHTHDACPCVVHVLPGQPGYIHRGYRGCHGICHNPGLPLQHVVIRIAAGGGSQAEFVGPADIQHRIVLRVARSQVILGERGVQRPVVQHRGQRIHADQSGMPLVMHPAEIYHPLFVGDVVSLGPIGVFYPYAAFFLADVLQQRILCSSCCVPSPVLTEVRVRCICGIFVHDAGPCPRHGGGCDGERGHYRLAEGVIESEFHCGSVLVVSSLAFPESLFRTSAVYPTKIPCQVEK